MTNDGGPAFPVQEPLQKFDDDRGVYVDVYQPVGGMSLRDYFAAKAMARYVYSDGTNDPALAARAYQIADAMIAERNRVK
jgi:hypothetical protein